VGEVHAFAEDVYVVTEPVKKVKCARDNVGDSAKSICVTLCNQLNSLRFKNRFQNPEDLTRLTNPLGDLKVLYAHLSIVRKLIPTAELAKILEKLYNFVTALYKMDINDSRSLP
jgi:hypothetical protein